MLIYSGRKHWDKVKTNKKRLDFGHLDIEKIN